MIMNKILVTGGAGFIGSHLTQRLLNEGAKVSVIVKYNSIIDCPRLVKIWNKINIIEADLRNTDSVKDINKLKFDVVFHLAAYNHVGDSFKHVLENINSNLISTINLLNSYIVDLNLIDSISSKGIVWGWSLENNDRCRISCLGLELDNSNYQNICETPSQKY